MIILLIITLTPGLLTYVQCSQVQETRGALSLEKYVVNDDDDMVVMKMITIMMITMKMMIIITITIHQTHDAHLLEDIDTNSSSDSPVKKS